MEIIRNIEENTNPSGHFEAATSKTRYDWITPPEEIDKISRVRKIVLDPCAANDPGRWFATMNLNLDASGTDGLKASWFDLIKAIGPGLVFVNPPYGSRLLVWAQKAVAEFRAGCEVILLAPSRTETKWFWTLLDAGAAVNFPRKRIRFLRPDGVVGEGPKFPNAYFYLGNHSDDFDKAFDDRRNTWLR